MLVLLQELRSALAHELAMHGPYVPLAATPGGGPPVSVQPALQASTGSSPPVTVMPPPKPLEEADVPMATTDLFGKELDPAEDPTLSPYERIAALIPKGSPLLTLNTLAEVEQFVNDTVLIPLDEIRLNAVFGVGNPEADLMIIGEAPGADEDRKGEPFVGRAGQLLTKILDAIGFQREDVYIANILKSRPPGNRDPEPEEIQAHIPILYKQIALIQPKLLLCVGKTAGNSLLGRRSSLGALRGKFHDFYGLPVMATYHPAALLRNPQWKRPTWDDVKLLRARYDELVGQA